MAVPSVVHRDPPVNPEGSRQAIPWREATLERVDQLSAEVNVPITGSTQQILRTIEGSGFITGIVLYVVATGGTGGTPAFSEDGPLAVLDSVVLSDVAGEVCNVSGFNLMLAHLANRWGFNVYAPPPGTAPSTTNVAASSRIINFSNPNFTFPVRVPVATDWRTYLGSLGNQDRSQRYQLRTNIGASGAVYATPPTTLPTLTISKFYENRSVPMPTAPDGSPQQVLPPLYGTTHYTTQSIADASPVASSTVQHFLQRIGNTIRWIGLVFRAGGSTTPRGTADTNVVSLRLKLGETTVYNDTYAYRLFLMQERYGFEFPLGVLIYDFIHDFGPFAGYSLNNDVIHSQALVNSRFEITYGSGMAAGSTLTFVTSDMIYKQPEVAIVS
jgi:hypothetical protein